MRRRTPSGMCTESPDPNMTRRYQHVMAGMLEDAAARLERIFPAAVM